MKTAYYSQPFRLLEIMIHVIGWGIVFAFPFAMISRSGFAADWRDYLLHGGVVPCFYLFVFYLNYFGLIPRFLFNGFRKKFLFLNLLLFVLVAWAIHFWQEWLMEALVVLPRKVPMDGPPRWLFILRDLFSMILTVGFCVAIRLSGRWMQIEAERRAAKQSQTEAELKNLRNQLNPHFLLNTLNNIYALIAFDRDKAQNAVQELSKLLRHVLYDNQYDRVPIGKEIDFIRNYIELMRIRMLPHVELKTVFDVCPDSPMLIAPLIFISLIENAFKHGISPTEPSYIYISFRENGQELSCEIANSYHPKNKSDKSGSGIGLEQVSKRLELIYSGRYNWRYGIGKDGREYRSLLNITLDEL